ncbi:putative metabolite transport protein [Neolecta irregularis DAH-3]|uniref:Putative metabolite transport protein n=1 Tax=Neolecta irregularis (strain DAH-3) TaxID=1198029 RepID=A0A1U7LS14_NEOID|nr:putative metabolite transport protein [Neolecta irregularis DAH-3]|eukprot:OLL25373.1 putative metabolite transport protein [Neolecta irregularis DAH-3]
MEFISYVFWAMRILYPKGEMNTPEAVVSCGKSYELTTGLITPCIDMSRNDYALATSIYAIGGLIGAVGAGTLARRGPRTAMLWNTIPGISGPLLMALATNKAMLITGRLISGLQSGVAMVVGPIYLSEISPKNIAGPLGIMSQLTCVIGILFTQILASCMSTIPLWRVLFGLGAYIQIIQTILLFWVVESPKFLFNSYDADSAEAILYTTRTNTSNDKNDNHVESLNELTWTVFSQWRKAFGAILVLMLSQQFCGINVVIFYSTTTLSALFGEFAKYLSVIIQIVNFFTTLAAAIFVNRIGRKKPLITSIFGMGTCSIFMCIGIVRNMQLLTAIGAILFVASFGFGLGPMPFAMAVEMVSGAEQISRIAPSFGIAVNLMATFVVAYAFPALQAAMGGYVFVIFASISFVACGINMLFVPETSRKTNAREVWTDNRGNLRLKAAAVINVSQGSLIRDRTPSTIGSNAVTDLNSKL